MGPTCSGVKERNFLGVSCGRKTSENRIRHNPIEQRKGARLHWERGGRLPFVNRDGAL